MPRTTKLELEQLLAKANATIQEQRLRISVLEGAQALRAPAPQSQNRITTIRGVQCEVIVERRGQNVVKRFVPLSTV